MNPRRLCLTMASPWKCLSVAPSRIFAIIFPGAEVRLPGLEFPGSSQEHSVGMVESCVRGGSDLTFGSVSLPRGWSHTPTGFLERWSMPRACQYLKKRCGNGSYRCCMYCVACIVLHCIVWYGTVRIVLYGICLCPPGHTAGSYSAGCRPTPLGPFPRGSFPATLPQACSVAWGCCDPRAGPGTEPC